MAEVRQVGALLLATGVGLTIWSFADRESNDRHEVSERISEVRLASSSADVTIRTDDVDKTVVEEQRTYWFLKRGKGYEVNGSTLKLDGDCGWQCRADYVITVPRGTKVTGENGSGDLEFYGVGSVDARSQSGDVLVEDVTGDVKVELTSGDLSIDRVTGKVELESTSGDVEATRLKGGPVTAKTTSGDVKVELDEAADVTAEGRSGDVEITAPAGSYRTETSTRSGDVENAFGQTSDGTRLLKATTVSGDVELHSR
ncbi:putative adhesin [Kribbella amoyensis]|uniref:Putative adhesin n=1 Tax=Kribbella amoyensis TaxID=996641 RepID=A0A561BN87_9ACTN|nr:DUF4097 family beta strand repeat-containing protein [Kribbella amoyensis]TWD80329.1 putative adhesin [Kribbella amoyensis]